MNSFSKEERVAFEQILAEFEDYLVMSRNVDIFRTDQTMMERTGDIIWRPQPYIAQSFEGMDQTANFKPNTQLSVPARIGFQRSVPWIMDSRELRDALQEGRLGRAARQKLASDINVAVLTAAVNLGSIVVTKVGAAATGFADVAAIESAMNRVGIQDSDRYLALSTLDYNGLATDLANRQNMVDMTKEAYRRGYVGMISSFETYKLDYSLRLAAAQGGGSITVDTRASAVNYYTPKATVSGDEGTSNVDNRYQDLTVSSTANVAAGDAFTLATVEEVHHITKLATGNLKSFRVKEVIDGTTLRITPPIISAQGGTDAELQYQNCVVNTPASNSAMVFLNTATKNANPFWYKGAIELLPGRLAIPNNAGAAVMRSTTENGIELVMTKQFDINTQKTKFRIDVYFGVNVLQPEMCGIALFSQT